jgi:hypothetical protein
MVVGRSPVTTRLRVALLLLCLGPVLGSCSSFSGYMADHWPHWAGGMPADAPPRPGAPGYDEFIAHGQQGANAARPGAPGTSPPPQFQAVPRGQGGAQAGTQAGTQAHALPQPQAAPQAQAMPAPEAPPAAQAPPNDQAVMRRGGLY